MVEYKTPNQECEFVPAGVQVEHNPYGRPISAVAEVIVRHNEKSNRIAIGYEIEDSTARLQNFHEPAPISQEHFQSLPIATRQIEHLDCVDRVERPEKTIGDAIMKGHNITNSEQRNQYE